MMSLEATAATEGCCLKLTWRWIKHSKSSLTKKGRPCGRPHCELNEKLLHFNFVTVYFAALGRPLCLCKFWAARRKPCLSQNICEIKFLTLSYLNAMTPK
jgi:hypothetical protein